MKYRNVKSLSPVSFSRFVAVQSGLEEVVVLMAIKRCRTRFAVERIYRAEMEGRARSSVIAIAAHKMDDFDHPSTPKVDVRSDVRPTLLR